MHMGEDIKDAKHRFLRFDFSEMSFADAEKVLDEMVKGGWYIVSSHFGEDGTSFTALLEWLEFKEEEEKKEWEQ